ncbi:hypothetical protein KF840_18440 [bacterium]|nr:hypothetical protein [bacterium]
MPPPRRRTRIAPAALLLAALPLAAPAGADGGAVRLSERVGDLVITVFTSPTPLRAGPIDVSALLLDGRSGDVIGDAGVTVTLRNPQPEETMVTATASRAQATNKLLYAALLDLPAAGAWRVEVAIDRAGHPPAAVTFDVDAAPPLPPWRTYWPYFALPALAVAVYALHQWLVLRRRP